MKRLTVLMLVFAILLGALSGCAVNVESCATSQGNEIETEAATTQAEITRTEAGTSETLETTATVELTATETTVNFSDLSNEDLAMYIENSMYFDLETEMYGDEYMVQNVDAIYVSREYIEEINYNSQANIFFGYTLAELDDQFQGTRYVFTLSDTGQTTVTEFEIAQDDTFQKVLENVLVGSGVILVCVTLSAATAGVAPAISIIFSVAAKGAFTLAVSEGLFSAVTAGIVEGLETGDFSKAIKTAALSGSEEYKWAAISGFIDEPNGLLQY